MAHPGHTASGGAARFRGYIEGMTEAGLDVGPDQVAQGFFSYRSGLDAAERLLGNGWNPTAVFASNDEMAAATIAVAHRRGLMCRATSPWRASTTRRSPP